jgi:membrane protein YqaA with SNARE-associated domain
MKNWFRIIQIWSLQWANTKWGAWALFFCAFADASFFPLPTPMFFVTITLLTPPKAYRYALFGTLGVFFGALAGYTTGSFAWINAGGEFSGFAQFMFNSIPGFSEALYFKIFAQFEEWNFWILFAASFMPAPFSVFSILSGVFGINLFMFCVAVLLGQGMRYYIMAFLILKLGPKVKKLFEINWKPFAVVATASIAILILFLKL